jgi:3-deoxy-D-manno-octulosonic-acid transferase
LPEMTGGVSFALYRGLTGALAPAIPALLQNRLRRGKEDPRRVSERRGVASLPRPAGKLIWIHAASVGESLAALPLAPRLLEQPGRSVLVTTGTVTSAELMQQRLPLRAFHQYVPLDLRGSVVRFLDHWRPDLALFVESELWPNLLLETRRRNIPLALVNARISPRSFAGWRRIPGFSRRIFSSFDICLAQDSTVAQNLTSLGARNVRIGGNLKADAPPLPVDEAALAAFRQAIGDRAVFLASSTHAGEDEAVLDTASALKDSGALTVIVPRHAERGIEIEALTQARGLSCCRRRNSAVPAPDTQVYIADTMGELGLFYRIACAAFMGGSLIPHGGQNPLEGARLAVPIIAGPHTANFGETYRTLFEAQTLGRIASGDELPGVAMDLLTDNALAKRIGERARSAAGKLGGALTITVQISEQLLAHART